MPRVPGAANAVEPAGRWGRICTVRAPRARVFDRRYRLLLPRTDYPDRYFSLLAHLHEARAARVATSRAGESCAG